MNPNSSSSFQHQNGGRQNRNDNQGATYCDYCQIRGHTSDSCWHQTGDSGGQGGGSSHDQKENQVVDDDSFRLLDKNFRGSVFNHFYPFLKKGVVAAAAELDDELPDQSRLLMSRGYSSRESFKDDVSLEVDLPNPGTRPSLFLSTGTQNNVVAPGATSSSSLFSGSFSPRVSRGSLGGVPPQGVLQFSQSVPGMVPGAVPGIVSGVVPGIPRMMPRMMSAPAGNFVQTQAGSQAQQLQVAAAAQSQQLQVAALQSQQLQAAAAAQSQDIQMLEQASLDGQQQRLANKVREQQLIRRALERDADPIVSSAIDAIEWTTYSRTEPWPSVRQSSSLSRIKQGMVLIGGTGGDSIVSKIDTMTPAICRAAPPDSVTWTPLTPMPEKYSIHSHSATTVKIADEELIVIFGGFWNGKLSNDVMFFEPGKNIWHEGFPVQGEKPKPRASHSAITWGRMKDKIIVFGGYGVQELYHDLYAFTPATRTWEQIRVQPNSPVPPPRHSHVAAQFHDFIVIFGGTDSKRDFNDLWCFDTDRLCWEERKTRNSPPVRSGHVGHRIGSRLFVIGGLTKDKVGLCDLWSHDFIDSSNPTRSWVHHETQGIHISPGVSISASCCTVDENLGQDRHRTDISIFGGVDPSHNSVVHNNLFRFSVVTRKTVLSSK